MFTVRAPNRAHSGISAGVSFTAGVGHTDNSAALAYFRKAGYELTREPEPAPPTSVAAEGEDGPRGTTEKPLERMNKAGLHALADELGVEAEGTNRELVARIQAKRAEG